MTYEKTSNYETFYEGTYSQLDPNYGPLFLGYRLPFYSLQLHTNPQTANIASEASDRLSQGVKGVMINVLDPKTFENIPRQMFDEVRQQHKLMGGDAQPSLHAPIIDPAGFGGKGEWSESSRAQSEAQLKSAIDRGHQADPIGNMPVTIHASQMPSVEWWKQAPKKEKGKEGKSMIYAVNSETKQVAPLPYETKYYPGEEGVREETFTPEEALRTTNNSSWHNRVVEIENEKIHADRLLKENFPTLAPVWKDMHSKEKAGTVRLTPEQQEAFSRVNSVMQIYDDVSLKLNGAFHDAYSHFKRKYDSAEDNQIKTAYGKSLEVLKQIGKQIHKAAVSRQPVIMHNTYSQALHQLDQFTRGNREIPERYQSIEDFALPHASKTIANVALHAYKKYGSKAPVLAIENIYPNMAFSRAESLKKLILESRKKFVETAMKEGYSESRAEAAAEKFIGATWDVGHANILKKHGYSEKDTIEEAKKIAPFTKFVHLTDNFGFDDSHLPPGMGDINFKGVLRELEKAGKLKHAIEAGGLLNLGKEAGRAILPTTLETLGAPMSSYAPGAMPSGPFWNQSPYVQGSYPMGYGMMLPDQHFSLYGSGFSTLPQELGGQVSGRGQRFSGRPME